jgi:hypothetical protein
MASATNCIEQNFDIGLAPQIAIAGWRGIVSIDGRAVAGASFKVEGGKASVSRRNGGGKREECRGEEWALHGKRLLRYISNQSWGDACVGRGNEGCDACCDAVHHESFGLITWQPDHLRRSLLPRRHPRDIP